ncbi:hypothetical protein GOEFS_050_00730 [Gordonia effusa NBRC 100432]|uniref:Secreted protein n=1 Tax=Gordonia effusa NBRC 100432 TaxID=1077974 RepID=H0QZP4_9ACTN|nr:hypothetical protein [Gordonia effusa]GAB18295.1 hypothetical protein GOEFS_050_00730 [Gordonia effusa NBRC 100432]
MNQQRFRMKFIAAAVAVAGAFGATLTGAAPAAAVIIHDKSTDYYDMSKCIGLSPNVVDLPYQPIGIYVTHRGATTGIATKWDSYLGYHSDARIDLRNLKTGKRFTWRFPHQVTQPYNGSQYREIPTSKIGKGRVQLTLNSVNRNALWALPAPTCSTVITIR